MYGKFIRLKATIMAGIFAISLTACGDTIENSNGNLANNQNETNNRVVDLFTPMAKSDPTANNIARTAQEKTIINAEDKLNLVVEYRTYTAENYLDATYDDVVIQRATSGMDDFYLLNPDVIQKLGEEDILADLSTLECAENLRDVVKVANTVDGKLVAIPQEVVAYGLFVNKDMFDKYNLELPNTPEELLECCRVFKENGIETPIGANRWWLECFVLAMGYADMYNGGNTTAEIDALNSGETKLSDYMRSGFEYLQTMIDLGYIDPQKAYTYEAIDDEGDDFRNQKTPIVMAYWSAANAETAYGNVDFNLKVIGFPSDLGQMPVVSMTGYGILKDAEHFDDTVDVLECILSDEQLELFAETNNVISPSKNVSVTYSDALQPLGDLVNSNVYVLGSNASMKVEQWGNICLIVRDLLSGSTVDECMAEFDKLQEDSLK